MEKIIIAAVSKNFVIGKDGKIPWYNKKELEHFKKTTQGFPVIMGRITWESLQKPLSGRMNIIITRKKIKSENPNVLSFPSFIKAIKYCERCAKEKCYIIGGEQVFKSAIKIADKMILSFINKEFDGDKFFPKISKVWEKIETKNFDEFSINTYIRKREKDKIDTTN